MSWFEAFIIAIIEGITEFLPVSSTGHMILTQEFLGIENSDFIKALIVNIKFGAILSVVVLYWKRFFQSLNFYFKLFVAFIPAAILGFLLSDFIDSMLENVWVVAISLLLGGFILLFIDNWFKNLNSEDNLSYPGAFKIGLFQCIAMIPGVSRSAASIIGGMTQKLNRKSAAEFSFFLAVPTMFAASAYKLLQNYDAITPDKWGILAFGNLVAFLVAMLAIKSFIGFLTKYCFKAFGYYRIVLGLLLIVLLSLGIDLEI